MNDASPDCILIVEDEEKIASLLSDYLQQIGGYQTCWLSRGDEVLDWLEKHQAALVILDVMLPGMNGMDVCKAIRQTSNIPIMMVTARVEEIDRLLGLELGADDYLCKPVSPREVVARVKAILRRCQQSATDDRTVMTIHPQNYQVIYQQQDLALTPVEFSLLQHLHQHVERVFSRQQLLDLIYSDHRIVSDRTVDTHIKNIRRKLAQIDPDSVRIESVYGVGYRLST